MIEVKNKFKDIFVINLDSATDRLFKINSELKRFDIPFKRWKAVPGSDQRFNNIKEKDITPGWNNNARGLCQTTIDILNHAIENNLESVMIIEDDAGLVENFKDIFSFFMYRMEKCNIDWEFIHLSPTHRVRTEYVAPYIYKVGGAINCQMYVVHKSMFEIYKNELQKFEKPIDEVTFKLHKRGKTYCPSASLVYHIPYKYSTLRNQVVNY